MTGRVVVVGDTAVDYYLRLPRGAWAAGDAADEKITAEDAVWLPGGTGANAAVTAQVLGSDVSLHSAVGDDPQGDWLTKELADRGVGTDHVQVFPGASTHATILMAGGARQVIVARGVADRLDALTPPRPGTADVSYLTGSGPAVRRMSGAGLPGFVIAGIECGMAGTPGLAGALRGVQLAITNSAGLAAFAEQLPAALTLIETQGTRGVTIHYPDRHVERISAVAAATVDATGAGDCLAGALCHYLAAHLKLTAAVRLAVAAAALSTRALGAQSALPTDAEVRGAATDGGPG